jgi:hypothetical protein
MSGRSYVLTEAVTVGGTGSVTSVTQDATQYLDVNGAADATIVVECFALSAPVGGTVVLNVQSSPFFDETTFKLAAPPLTLSASPTPFILKTVAAVSVAGLARQLRWNITTTGSGAWSVTFRIRVVTNRTSYFGPTQLSGCTIWLRADMGITLVSGSVDTWADQSGNGYNATAPGTRPGFSANAVNNLPAITGNGTNQLMTTVPFPVAASMTWAAVINPTGVQNGYVRIIEQAYDQSYYLGVDVNGNKYKLIVNNNVAPFGLANGGTVASGPVIVSASYASPRGDVYVNGTSVGHDNFTAPTTGGPNLALYIMDAYNGFTEFWNGAVAEIVVYNRQLSSSEFTRLHRYLGGRYGITVP